MADVDFGFVHDFGAREEFAASRGGGATAQRPPDRRRTGPTQGLEVVGLESADPSWIVRRSSRRCSDDVYRLRVVGSIAITLTYVAAGRFDAMLSARACRSVDAAAAQLIVREAGGAVEFVGLELERGRARPRCPLRRRRRRSMPTTWSTIRAAQAPGPDAADEHASSTGISPRESARRPPAPVPAAMGGLASTSSARRSARAELASTTPGSTPASRFRRPSGSAGASGRRSTCARCAS